MDGTRRLALGYNHLSGLPMEFAQLGSSLRYLNVRVNYLTIFPAVVRDDAADDSKGGNLDVRTAL
jgi:hypothetical protein